MAELTSASCWLVARRLLSCSGLRFGAPFAKRWRLRLRWTAIQLVHDLREVIAGLGGLAEGEVVGNGHKGIRRSVAALWAAGRPLQPAPYARAVATVDITELALEIGFLAGYNAVADDERKEHQHHQQPEIVERDG
jgi:hypothetical protein